MKLICCKHLLAAALMAFAGLASVAHAAVEAGKVYRFANVAYPDKALTGNGQSSGTTANSISPDDYSQYWLAENASNGAVYLRNLNNGTYLESSRAMSVVWGATLTANANCAMNITENDSYLLVRAYGDNNNYGYMHCDGSSRVVSWSNDAAATRWTASVIDISQSEIEDALAKADELNHITDNISTIQNALNAMFADKACTKLNSTYQNMSASKLASDANYKALPAQLQNMVKKVQSGNWAESDTRYKTEWDSKHAKKFRVQSYEPFSRGAEAANMMGVQAYTNMNNPTGILTNSHDVLYVMVNEAPKDGSTLYIDGAVGPGMFNDYNSGVELHDGLNIIPMWANKAAQYIYYTVDTYNSNTGARKHRLPDFNDITIHIEGGSVNGFFNHIGDELYAPDTNEDWAYYRTRAQHDMFDLVGEYVILHFFFDQVMTKPDGGYLTDGLKGILDPSRRQFDLPEIMTAWDDMCFAERLIIGAQSSEDILSPRAKGYYEPMEGDKIASSVATSHEYFNNRMMGITMQGDLYMNATSWRTAYNPSTAADILLHIKDNSGAIWGPAHEYGHINQYPMKFAGTTEISNNVFSNVAVFYQGIATSRADYPSRQREIFNKNLTYLENGTWGTTRMFMQLWLYYHATGHNKKFYPRLYELLRKNPRQQSYYLNCRYDMLHFAKMCCMAAEEDLTDFFTAWGFFVPLDNYFIGDYSEFYATLTQEDIDAVKREIADMKYPKNNAMLFIDDRPGSDRQSYSGFAKEECGELGGLKDFAAGTKSDGKYVYSVSGLDITLSGGKGGVGFAAYDGNGNIITFANTYSWTMTVNAAEMLATGKAKIYSVGSDNTLTEVPNVIDRGTADQKKDLLTDAIAAARGIIALADETETKVSWYRASALVDLSAAVETAESALSSGSSDAINSAYHALATEYYGLLKNTEARIAIEPGYGYRIVNKGFSSRALSVNSRNQCAATTANESVDSQVWFFTQSETDGQFYIRNKANGMYIGSVESNATVIPTTTVPVSYAVIELGDGVLALAANGDQGSNSLNIDPNYNVVRWSSSEATSQWTITCVGKDETPELITNLTNLIEKTDNLVKQAGTIETARETVELEASQFSSNANGDGFTSWDVLLDNNLRTEFKSASTTEEGTTDGLDHYIDIDLGTKGRSTCFSFTYTTRRNSTSYAPSCIVVYGSTTNGSTKTWEHVATFAEDLPKTNREVYLSDAVPLAKAFRHLRFMVTETHYGQDDNGHPSFVMAEFGLSKATVKATPSSDYPDVTAAHMENAYKSMLSGRGVVNADVTSSQLKDAYETLSRHYTELVNAMHVVGIVDIEGDAADNSATVIYDLSGRRLNTVTAPGIYIVNGKKLMLKPGDF